MNGKYVIALLVLGVLLAGCTNQPPAAGPAPGPVPVEPPATKEPIKLGFIGPLSGDVAAIGIGSKEGVEMAVEEINQAGGINDRKVEVIYEDGKCSGAAAASAGNKLINLDKVSAIIGGLCSGETLAVAPVAEKAGVLMLSSCSSSPKVTEAGDYIFRDYPSDEFQGAFGAEYAFNELKARKVAIIYSLSDWGVPIKDRFKARFTELGGTIVAEEGVDDKIQDTRTQLMKLKSANPDAVYMPQYSGATAIILKQAKELGLTVPLLGGDAGNDPKVIEVGGSAAEGFLSTVPFSEPPKEWEAAYTQRTGHEVRLCGVHAYDAAKIMAKALAVVGDDASKLRDYLYAMPPYKGMSGEVSFDRNGDLKGARYSVLQVKNAKFEKVY
ncbi:MAG: ABC transporter substrate-binding protein [Candidatus Diapherotrites archaeon]|uniref:ABC transporter substrate-binding protein n=1 Tax=Candidatus Iainarchaeum sp. TaxID=3101447 RepID=A0A8T4LCF7_9ARCH|nr:ABC transporter substrate-binding protein [Candidatus Diapherotrites archaeon]